MAGANAVEDAIVNRQAFDSVFGGWSSFHDQLMLGLNFLTEGPSAPALEARFRLDGGYAQAADGGFRATSWYFVTLRFHNVADVALDEFMGENIVGELRLSALKDETDGNRAVLLEIEPIAGCGGSLTLACSAVEVLSVDGPHQPRPN